MDIKQVNKGAAFFSEAFIILTFLLGFIYILDDVVQVLSLSGVMEDFVFCGFFIGPFIVLPLSVVFWVKLNIKRFIFYSVMSIIQLYIIAVFAYIIFHSQV